MAWAFPFVPFPYSSSSSPPGEATLFADLIGGVVVVAILVTVMGALYFLAKWEATRHIKN